MPHIQAFRGIRYDLGHVGSLSDVIAPPYDVISDEFRDQLYEQHPANVVRLILNRQEPGDDDHNNRYSRASRLLRRWKNEGLLALDSDPAVYVYHQQFSYEGQEFNRRGFMARVRLEPFGTGKIYPHEETHAAAKADRLRLITACRANLSQIFGIYPDEANEAQELLEDAIVGKTPLEAADHLGVVHRLWPVTDVEVISRLAAVMDPLPMFVADGHHRYETACNYREALAEDGPLAADHPANFVLTMCVSMNDPGMIVLPTHRAFSGLPALTTEQLKEKLSGHFEIREFGSGKPEDALELWEEIETDDRQENLGLWSRASQQWLSLTLNATGAERMAEIAAEHSGDWQGLGVAILHRLIMEELLAATDLPKPTYVHQVSELLDCIKSGGTEAESFELAALVMPASLDHIRAISEFGERMPAKSTYFYPKLLSGLVINPLE